MAVRNDFGSGGRVVDHRRMKIVILDRRTMELAHEQFDYSGLRALGELVLFDYTREADLARHVAGADVVVVNQTPLTRENLGALTQARLICKAGTGFDNIDVEAARARGLTVCNLPGYGTFMVAQWTWGLLLALANSVGPYAAAGKEAGWAAQFHHPITELRNKTLGLVGLGAIGMQVATWAQAFSMQVCVYRSTSAPCPPGLLAVDLPTLAERSDFVSIHCRLNADTRGLVGESFLRRMKPTGYLVNTARAAIVDEGALIDALGRRAIAGAAMDVFWREPPPPGHPLLEADNLLLTPHMAWASPDTRQRVIDMLAQVIQSFVDGAPINVL